MAKVTKRAGKKVRAKAPTKKSGPRAMKAYASFAEWRSDQSPKNQRLIAALVRIVKDVAPEFCATVKWGQGCWTLNDAPKVYIHAEPDHVQFGFFAGSKLKDPEGLLRGAVSTCGTQRSSRLKMSDKTSSWLSLNR